MCPVPPFEVRAPRAYCLCPRLQRCSVRATTVAKRGTRLFTAARTDPPQAASARRGRTRVLVPPPHVTEHSVQAPHSGKKQSPLHGGPAHTSVSERAAQSRPPPRDSAPRAPPPTGPRCLVTGSRAGGRVRRERVAPGRAAECSAPSPPCVRLLVVPSARAAERFDPQPPGPFFLRLRL